MDAKTKLEKLNSIELYTLKEVSQVTGITEYTLARYIRTGRMKGIKIGRGWRVTGDNLRRFINGE